MLSRNLPTLPGNTRLATGFLRLAARPNTLPAACVCHAARPLTNMAAGRPARSYRSVPSLISSRMIRRSYGVLPDEPKATEYTFEDVKKLVEHPDPNVVLVDVREPDEYAAGHIPGAVNVPYKTSPGGLALDEEAFEETFGFPKPSTDKELVFYCLGGVRSSLAESLVATFGYPKRGNYIGSFADWSAKGGPVEPKPEPVAEVAEGAEKENEGSEEPKEAETAKKD